MTEKATCSNCDRFEYCNIAEFEDPFTCGNYEGCYPVIEYNEDDDYYSEFQQMP